MLLIDTFFSKIYYISKNKHNFLEIVSDRIVFIWKSICIDRDKAKATQYSKNSFCTLLRLLLPFYIEFKSISQKKKICGCRKIDSE